MSLPARVHRPFEPRRSLVSQKLWRSMRMLRAFTYQKLEITTEGTRRYITNYCIALHRAGYLRRSEAKIGPRRKSAVWTLIRDTGPNPPMCRRDGTVFDTNEHRVYGEATQQPARKLRDDRSHRGKAWRAMRILGGFTLSELVWATGAKRRSIGRYVWALERCGFLERGEALNVLTQRTSPYYTLVRDSGDVAPVVRRSSVVYDPNTKQHHEPEARNE